MNKPKPIVIKTDSGLKCLVDKCPACNIPIDCPEDVECLYESGRCTRCVDL